MLADVGHIVVVDDDPSLRQLVISIWKITMYRRICVEPNRIQSSFYGTSEPDHPGSAARSGRRAGSFAGNSFSFGRSGHHHDRSSSRRNRSHRRSRTRGRRYIVKPFSLRELLARVRAVLRRQEMGRVARARDPERGGYRFDGWQLDGAAEDCSIPMRPGRAEQRRVCVVAGLSRSAAAAAVASVGAKFARLPQLFAASASIAPMTALTGGLTLNDSSYSFARITPLRSRTKIIGRGTP